MVFDKPNFVEYEDLILVTFWKRAMYMSKLTGKRVPFGTEVSVRIALQVDEGTRETLDSLLLALIILVCAILLISLVVKLFKGRENIAMPLWMSVNSL